MCQLAHMMHERVVRPADPNCNWRGVDFFQLSSAEPYAPQYASYPSCEVRAAYFAAHGYTYAQVERPIESSDICPQQFMYGTSTQCCFCPRKKLCSALHHADSRLPTHFAVLRDPVALAISRIKVAFPHEARRARVELQCIVNASRRSPGARNATRCVAGSGWPIWHYFDNPMTRLLAGRPVMDLPPLAVTMEHAEIALARLSRFSVVLPLESIGTREASALLLREFGWQLGGAGSPSSTLNMTANVGRVVHREQLTAQEQAHIRNLAAFDYKLYDRHSASLQRPAFPVEDRMPTRMPRILTHRWDDNS